MGLLTGLLKSITRITSFIGKEITEILRRPGVLLSLVLGPFLIMAIFGMGYSGQRRPLNTVIVLPEGAGLPRDVGFYQQYAGPAIHILEIGSDVNQARSRLSLQHVDLLVVAPADVEQTFLSGRQSVITVEYNQVDPVRDNYVRFVAHRQAQELNRGIIQQVVSEGKRYVVEVTGGRPPAEIPPEVVAAPTRAETVNVAPTSPSMMEYFAPAVLALIIQHMAVTLTALSMVRERLSGAVELFRLAPVSTLEILIGKYVAYAFFNLAIAALVTFLIIGGLHVPLLGTPGDFAGAVALLTFASLGLGLLISLIADSERQAVQLSMLLLLASVFLSGFVLPLDEFQPAVQALAAALPVTHGIRLLQDFMLRGGTNADWQLMALGGISLALFLLSSIGLRRTMSSA
jgi:ABC-2 type transport system permease protein